MSCCCKVYYGARCVFESGHGGPHHFALAGDEVDRGGPVGPPDYERSRILEQMKDMRGELDELARDEAATLIAAYLRKRAAAFEDVPAATRIVLVVREIADSIERGDWRQS